MNTLYNTNSNRYWTVSNHLLDHVGNPKSKFEETTVSELPQGKVFHHVISGKIIEGTTFLKIGLKTNDEWVCAVVKSDILHVGDPVMFENDTKVVLITTKRIVVR